MTEPVSHDVLVIGGGPVGCVAALGHARMGKHVVVLEGNRKAANRFAGEWIHPTGVDVLDQLGLDRLARQGGQEGHGFVVFPEDGSEPIVLPYPDGQVAVACDHALIVEAVRERAEANEFIDFRDGARVDRIDGNTVSFKVDGERNTLSASRLIGADGRGGVCRTAAGLSPRGDAVSYMASVELRDVELPFEGYGHVFLGGPGPVLMYRIGPNRVRGCFDVPIRQAGPERNVAFLKANFTQVLPASIRQAFTDGLERGPVPWTTNRFAARAGYGQGPLWLVGDAVGHFHPLSAAGLSLGFLDAQASAGARQLRDYQDEREALSYVPEVLSNALYQVFSRTDTTALAIRRAMYSTWRADPVERERTMRILMGSAVDAGTFGASFVRMAIAAMGQTASRLASDRRWLELPGALGAFREWAQWPAATLAPAKARKRYRARSTSERPMPIRVAAQPSKPAEPKATAPGAGSNGSHGSHGSHGSNGSANGTANANGSANGSANASRPSTPPDAPPLLRWGKPSAMDWSESKRRLAEVSRTFAKPIGMLRDDLEVAVTCGYLLCRIADSIEDHPDVPPALRDPMFADYIAVLETGASPDGLIEKFHQIPGTDAELDLSRNLDTVLRVYGNMPARHQAIVGRWCVEMARGMNLYSHREPGEDGFTALHTVDDLVRYCYFVAGTVGHMLTELFRETMGDDLGAEGYATLLRHSENFGSGLQLVNILKDVTDDRQRHWSFVPRQACGDVGLGILDLTDPQQRAGAHEAVAPLFDEAEQRLEGALTYALTIPPQYPDVRMFCMLPLCMAALTLVHGRGNDAMFIEGKEVKISRMQVASVIKECALHVKDDAAMRRYYRSLWSARPQSDGARMQL